MSTIETSGQGCHVHEVFVAVAAYTGPAQDQVSQNSRTDGKLL